MSGRRRRGKKGNKAEEKPKPEELWRSVPAPPVPEPIAPADDPTALLRSLGNPPLTGQGSQAVLDLAAVVHRASAMATALAAAGGLLDEGDDEDDGALG